MNIAYIIGLGGCLSGKSNGVRMQAEGWAEELRKESHLVELIEPWGNYDWKKFDIIHIFGVEIGLDVLAGILKRRTNAALVYSPIIDTNRPPWLSRLASLAAFKPLHMTSPLSSLRAIEKLKPYYLARSEYEYEYIVKFLRCSPSRIGKVFLSYRLKPHLATIKKKEKICAHVSILSGPHKNVKRLINAAIKYNFELYLAGKYGEVDFYTYLQDVLTEYKNIHYLGFLTNVEMIDLFCRAKCFALPSTFEGVGLVALDAAVCGCDIVMTNRGAPQEYYNGMAQLVDPESIDDIGKAIVDILQGHTFQPALGEYIAKQFSPKKQCQELSKCYRNAILENG